MGAPPIRGRHPRHTCTDPDFAADACRTATFCSTLRCEKTDAAPGKTRVARPVPAMLLRTWPGTMAGRGRFGAVRRNGMGSRWGSCVELRSGGVLTGRAET